MAVDQYKLGYEEYKNTPTHTNEYIKQQHPLWRAGYRKSQQDHAKLNQLTIPNKLYEVQRTNHVYCPTWNDIMAATRKPRYSKLHKDELQPLLFLLISEVEKKKDQLTSYSKVREAVDVGFNIILQYGYDQGILNRKDLEKLDYVPK